MTGEGGVGSFLADFGGFRPVTVGDGRRSVTRSVTPSGEFDFLICEGMGWRRTASGDVDAATGTSGFDVESGRPL